MQNRGIDEAFLDVTEVAGSSEEIARRIKQAILDATRLTCSIGIAPNKLLAKMASELEKDAFRDELAAEVRLHDPAWEARVAEGPAAIQALLRRFRPFSAHRVLRPFLEAYRVVADALARRAPDAAFDQDEFLRGCLALGQQYVLQRRILSPESVSRGLFATALRLAQNRTLVASGAPDLAERRRVFAEEVRLAIRRIDAVAALVAARHAGLIE